MRVREILIYSFLVILKRTLKDYNTNICRQLARYDMSFDNRKIVQRTHTHTTNTHTNSEVNASEFLENLDNKCYVCSRFIYSVGIVFYSY